MRARFLDACCSRCVVGLRHGALVCRYKSEQNLLGHWWHAAETDVGLPAARRMREAQQVAVFQDGVHHELIRGQRDGLDQEVVLDLVESATELAGALLGQLVEVPCLIEQVDDGPGLASARGNNHGDLLAYGCDEAERAGQGDRGPGQPTTGLTERCYAVASRTSVGSEAGC